ncbi:MAG: hypothetical protein ACOCRK_09400 [bacterium]
MSEYTPGPWRVEHDNCYGWQIYSNYDPNNTRVGDVCGVKNIELAYSPYVQFPSEKGQEVSKANAQLIAAAPELLEAAEELLKDLDTLGKSYPRQRQLEKVVKKAKEG